MSDKPTIQDRILARTDLIDAAQACSLLRLQTDTPEVAMQGLVREGAVIDILHHGEVVFPRFQFDTENTRVFGVVTAILKIRPPRISNLRLVYWMTRSHADFGLAPAEVFGQQDAAILAAFRRYIEPEWHG